MSQYFIKRQLCVGIALFLAGMAGANAAAPNLFVPREAPNAPAPATRTNTVRTMRERNVDVSFDALGRGEVSSLNLNLFVDTELAVERSRIETRGENNYSWFGRVSGDPLSSVIMVVKDGRMSANVQTSSAIYEIRPVRGGGHSIRQVDTARLPSGDCPPNARMSIEPRQSDLDAPPPPAPQAACLPALTIDVMVVYTQAADDSLSDIDSEIQLAVDDANQSYSNSGINQRVRLVHSEKTSYTESGDPETDRNRLQDPGDGYMDNVHAIRDQYGADLVNLWIGDDDDLCGIAYIMETVSTGFADHGFAVVVGKDCAVSNHSFAHELGHVMSARHDRYVDTTDGKPYNYNHGYINTGKKWRTVMAYNDQCKAGGYDCTRLGYWSNPGVNYNSDPTGIADGQTNPADNHTTLNNTASTVEAFRGAKTPLARAGGDQTVECSQPNAAAVTLNGGGSCDPNGDSLSYAWTGPFGTASGVSPTVTYPLGTSATTLVVNDGGVSSLSSSNTIVVRDTKSPSGKITGPAPALCTASAVTVTDSFSDVCDTSLSRTYSPGPGPTYTAPGDYTVFLTVRDDSGNSSTDSVSFSIDQSKPTVVVNSPSGQQNITPSSVPFSVVFTAQDNDAAGGGVVHEVLKLAGCTVYDGYSYGDNDGLLSDESLPVTKAEMCKIATQCGFTELNRPVLTVEATDCAGNVGVGSFTYNGSLKLVPWACSP